MWPTRAQARLYNADPYTLASVGRWRFVLPALLVLSRAAPSWAQVRARERLSLEWSAPDGCPPREAVLDALDRLRAPAAAPRTAPTRVSAAVERQTDGRWSLDLEVGAGDAASRRHVVAATCEQLVSVAALVTALSLDASSTAPPPPPSPRAPAVAPAAPPRRVRRASSPVRFAARAEVGVDVGALPGPSAGLGLTVSVAWRRLRVEASFRYALPRAAVNAEGYGGDVALAAGALRGCYVLHRGRLEPRLCGAVEGGAMLGESVGLPQVGAGSSPWWAAFGGAALGWSVAPRLALVASVDVGAPLSSPRFVIGGLGEVHRPSAVLVRGAVGVEWRFP